IGDVIQTHNNIWSRGVYSAISYLGEVLYELKTGGGLPDTGFAHLDGENTQREFALLVTQGLMETPGEKITATMQATARISQERLYSSSLSAASLVGMQSESWTRILAAA